MIADTLNREDAKNTGAEVLDAVAQNASDCPGGSVEKTVRRETSVSGAKSERFLDDADAQAAARSVSPAGTSDNVTLPESEPLPVTGPTPASALDRNEPLTSGGPSAMDAALDGSR